MHVDEIQCFCGSNVHCVVTQKSDMALYFPVAGSLNGSNADMCSDVIGMSISGSDDLFKLSDRSNTMYFYYFPQY